MRAILSDVLHAVAPLGGGEERVRTWVRRLALALALAACAGAWTAAPAGAYTLRLAFPDGQPMTYGSACAGLGCLQRGDKIERTDARGEVVLPGGVRTIEYRRDGVRLGLVATGVASGSVLAVGETGTVILPRMLVGSAPALDALESDLVARLNEARAAQGLAPAQINPKLSTASDLQATWLTHSGITFSEPGSFHDGPFESDLAFRHGEVSLPEPVGGGEIAEAGGTVDETIADWLSSPDHRDQILAPGKLLIGAGMVGIFTIVQTHRPCDGCAQAGTGTRASAPQAPPPLIAAPAAQPAPPPPAPTAGSSSVVAPPQPPPPACGREQLTTRRLKSLRGRVRLRVVTKCLRPGARYALLFRQGPTGRLLRTVRVTRAGTLTVSLRPSRATTKLGIKLKRDGRAIVRRTMSLRI
jgi:hypothetical protein